MRAAVITLALLAGATSCPAEPSPAPSPTTTVRCQEDNPCWNCKTMGDKKCGPTGNEKRL